jgi:hypothetical protein
MKNCFSDYGLKLQDNTKPLTEKLFGRQNKIQHKIVIQAYFNIPDNIRLYREKAIGWKQQFVCCIIVVPLPPGENLFAVK